MNRLELMLNRGQTEMITLRSNTNRQEADEVKQHVADYISAGGIITVVPPGASGMPDFAAKRTRGQVLESLRETSYRRSRLL